MASTSNRDRGILLPDRSNSKYLCSVDAKYVKKEGNMIGIDEQLEYAISCDDKDRFVLVINNYFGQEGSPVPEYTAFRIFGLDAVRCAAAVLDGETSPNFVNLITEGVPTQEFCDADQLKFPLLHKAAFCGAPKLTKLFLDRFGDEIVNLGWDSKGIIFPSVTGKMLPLNMTLEALGSDHEPIESVFKIIFRLMNFYYRHHLETLRLLVQRTNNVEKEFCYYVKEGKLSAVTALLLVAPEKFLPSSVNNQEFDSDRSINVREFVLDEVASMTILNMINTHVEATHESVMKLQNKKLEMEAKLQLIEVFERMGETLAAYLRINPPYLGKFATSIAWLFEDAGFNAKTEILSQDYRADSWGFKFSEMPDNVWMRLAQERRNKHDEAINGGGVCSTNELSNGLCNQKFLSMISRGDLVSSVSNSQSSYGDCHTNPNRHLETWALSNGLSNQKTVDVLAHPDHFSAVSSSQSSNSESLMIANRHLQPAVQMNKNVARLQTRKFCTSIMAAVRSGIRHL